MPTIVKNNSTKKLDNAIPIPNRFKQETYSNLSFPFGREFKLKLFDNSSQELTKLDLKQILYLAGQEQTKIWFN